ncbi:MAG: TonB-dependent receptor [Deltaproteobacteria bacterium]|nr:TonB-dependent receptor [Deltaproteobacteria bacterium]MCW5801610.1 TonB-dependent receptor [Deltaproteobacteria bacterium]
MRTTSTTLLLLGGLGGVASANGFYINEHDAKVTGRAGAAVASDTDASAIVYNPGGIAVSEGTQVSFGGALIVASGRYTDTGGAATDTNSSPAVLPQLMVTSKLHPMVAVGIGFHLPFGLAISWPETSPQADVALTQSLRTYFITPSVGVNLGKQVPGLSIGAGLDIVPSTVELTQAVTFGDPNNGGTRGSAQLGGDAFGIGFRAGVMYRPPALKALQVGVAYKSQVNLDFKGTGDFDIAAPYRNQLPPDGDIATSVTLPMSAQFGVAYRPIPKLQVEANASWINWSKFKEIRIDLPGDAPDLVSPQDYKDTVTFRLGAEYAVSPKIAVRGGYIYDPTPVPNTTVSARLPDANRHDVTLGGSYNMGSYEVNLGLLAVLPSKQETSDVMYQPLFKGTYEVKAFVASLGLNARFGK